MIEIQDILHLSVAERLSMVEKIWDSIDVAEIEMPLSHQYELDKRLARYKNGETTFVSWNDVKKDLKAAK